MKIVVNSCVAHADALQQLLTSLQTAQFPAADAVVVLGGSDVAEGPTVTVDGWVRICCKEQTFDYHGLTCLFRYREHELVKADGYLYIHDTCVADTTLPQRLATYDFSTNPACIYGPPSPAANICAFGHRVIVNIGLTYDCSISKREAINIEKGTSMKFPPIYRFGVLRSLAPRRRIGECNRYGDGTRTVYYYPAFGLYKYVTQNPLTTTRAHCTAPQSESSCPTALS